MYNKFLQSCRPEIILPAGFALTGFCIKHRVDMIATLFPLVVRIGPPTRRRVCPPLFVPWEMGGGLIWTRGKICGTLGIHICTLWYKVNVYSSLPQHIIKVLHVELCLSAVLRNYSYLSLLLYVNTFLCLYDTYFFDVNLMQAKLT
jgi:hypothetical protein